MAGTERLFGCARTAKYRLEEIKVSFETDPVLREIIPGKRFVEAGTKQSGVEYDLNPREGWRWL